MSITDRFEVKSIRTFHMGGEVYQEHEAREIRDWINRYLPPEPESMVGRTLTADDPEPPVGTVVARYGWLYQRDDHEWVQAGTAETFCWDQVTHLGSYDRPVTVLRWGRES